MNSLFVIYPPNPEAAQYQAACRENIDFVLEMLEAMRIEADMVGDAEAARFWAGAINVIAAFGPRSSARVLHSRNG
ncbi:MAG: hypothetical protein KF841_03060 [Phycisphaerae bacterium]|nr:hypothetical protein [Phycisphaerae bacterium]